VPNALSRLTEFKLTVIKVLNARLAAPFALEIDFSDHTKVFDANAYLANRTGPLLESFAYCVLSTLLH
jgi:hypothetical protein